MTVSRCLPLLLVLGLAPACGRDDAPSDAPDDATPATAELAWSTVLDTPGATTRILAGNWLLSVDTSGNITNLDASDGSFRWADEIDLQVPLTWAIWFDSILLPNGKASVYIDVSQGTRNENAFGDPSEDHDGMLFSTVGEDRISATYLGWNPAWAQLCAPDCTSFVIDGPTYTTAPTQIGDELLLVTADALLRAQGNPDSSLRATLTWQTDLDIDVDQPPLLSGDTVVVIDSAGPLAAFAAADGVPLWSHDASGALAGPVVVTDDEVLVVVTDDGIVETIGADDGAVRWTYDLGAPAVGGAAALDDEVFVATTGDVVSLDLSDGSARWSFAVEGTLSGAPVASSTRVTVGSEAGEVFAIQRP